jgi:hypothetical protein
MAESEVKIYRSLLRCAALLDARPRLKTLLRWPLVDESVAGGAVIERWRKAFAGKNEWPPRSPHSLTNFVKKELREQRRLSDAALVADASFNAHRALLHLLALDSESRTGADYVLPALHLSGAALEEAGVVRPGSLLVEEPGATRPGRSLVYLYDVSRADPESGAAGWAARGFAVNRPFPASVASVTGLKGLGRLGEETLFHGGMDGNGRLSVVHAFSDVPGAVAVNDDDDVYLGGNLDAINARLLAAGSGHESARPKVRVFSGTTELPLLESSVPVLGAQSEIPALPELELVDPDRWAFTGGSAVQQFLFCSPLFDTEGVFRDGHGLKARDQVVGYNHARFWHQNIAWKAAVKLLAESLTSSQTPMSAFTRAALGDAAELHPATVHYAEATLPLQWLALKR